MQLEQCTVCRSKMNLKPGVIETIAQFPFWNINEIQIEVN